MKIVDANILLYSVNRDLRHHTNARAWLTRALNGHEVVGFAPMVIAAYLRIATHPTIMEHPISCQQAIEDVDAWLTHPNAEIVSATPEHWHVLRDLLEQTEATGNLIPDAHLAALAICHAATLVSYDTDFSRFDGLRWVNPADND